MAGETGRVGKGILGWAGRVLLLRAILAIPWTPLRLAGIIALVLGPIVGRAAGRAWRRRSLWDATFALLAIVLVALALVGAQGSHRTGDVEIEPGDAPPAPEAGAVWLVDLNRASRAELEALPGVGPDRAAAIMAARAERPLASLAEAVERGVLPAAVAAGLEGWVGVFEVEPSP